jgi:hypothetical protein
VSDGKSFPHTARQNGVRDLLDEGRWEVWTNEMCGSLEEEENDSVLGTQTFMGTIVECNPQMEHSIKVIWLPEEPNLGSNTSMS